jgi:hypothetical protein
MMIKEEKPIDKILWSKITYLVVAEHKRLCRSNTDKSRNNKNFWDSLHCRLNQQIPLLICAHLFQQMLKLLRIVLVAKSHNKAPLIPPSISFWTLKSSNIVNIRKQKTRESE